MLKIDILPASTNQQTTFRNLFQFYIYEFSSFTGWATTDGGRFIEDDLEGCWTDDKRHPYLFRVAGEWAGLAIIDTLPHSRYSQRTNITAMSEFFVMAGFQGQGLGERAALQLFGRYPGWWEVYQLGHNTDAQAFWRQVIGRYTGGHYSEQAASGGVVQFFQAK